jgi:hypothetical protein
MGALLDTEIRKGTAYLAIQFFRSSQLPCWGSGLVWTLGKW